MTETALRGRTISLRSEMMFGREVQHVQSSTASLVKVEDYVAGPSRIVESKCGAHFFVVDTSLYHHVFPDPRALRWLGSIDPCVG